MPVEIRLDAPQLKETVRRLKEVPDALERAMVPAVKDFTIKFRRESQIYIADKSPLPTSITNKAVRQQGARSVGYGAFGHVSVKSERIPLIEFNVQPKKVTATQGKRPKEWEVFTYELFKDERRSGAEEAKGYSIPFVASVNGELQVYYRPSKENRDHISKIFGPSVQFYVSSSNHGLDDEAEDFFSDFANEYFPSILERYAEIALGV